MSTQAAAKNKVVTYGEVLLRVCPADAGERLTVPGSYYICPAGSEANVAVALANLAVPVEFVTALADDALGRQIVKELRKHGVGTDRIILRPGRTGLFFQERGVGVRPSFNIYDRNNSVFSEANINDYDWRGIWRQADWLHVSGIVPAVSRQAWSGLQQAIKRLPGKVTLSVDLNYRHKLWGWANNDRARIRRIMTELCRPAELLTANETDLQEVFGYAKTADHQKIAECVFADFPRLKNLALSLRQSASATLNTWSGKLFVRGQGSFTAKEYRLDSIVDRVGTGDSFTAGIIYGLRTFPQNPQKIIDFAVGLGALNHSTLGDFSAFSEQDVLNVLTTGGSGRINR